MRQSEFLRKGLAMLLALVVIIGFLPGVGSMEVSAEEGSTRGAASIKLIMPEGEGTEASPYQIGTAEELYWFARLVNGTLPSGEQNQSAHAVLTKNIVVNTGVFDANGDLVDTGNFIKWTPIGINFGKSFKGTFDGQNHTISGLYFDNTTEDFVGLFGCSKGGKILKVGVIDSYFKGNSYVSGVCAWNEEATITYCYNAGKVSGSDFVGGVCAYVYNGSIQYCYNTNAVEGTKGNVGGVCGRLDDNSSVKYSYNTGKVSGSDAVGGVCGDICDGTTIQYCYNTNVVEGTEPVGGVCGATYGGTVKDSYYDMEVYSNSVPIGINSNGKTTVANVEGKTTNQMHSEAFCKEMGYHLYQNGICALCVTAYQEAPYNNGTYEISNAGQLYWFADKVNSADTTYQKANAVLTADIVVNKNVLNSDGTLNGDGFKEWIPIGIEDAANKIDSSYIGAFDGQNHTISGLYSDLRNTSYANYVGLFGHVGTGGKVVNIGIQDSYFLGCITAGGGICGWNQNGTIDNCYNTGAVNGDKFVGGVCGENNGTLKNCYNTGIVSGTGDQIGGVCGINWNSIENCHNAGMVNSTGDQIGGVCGDNTGTLKNCYNTGAVSGSDMVGGVLGRTVRSTIENCYNIGKIEGSTSTGGVCGDNDDGTITKCYYNNEVYDGTAMGKENGTATKVEGKTTEEFKSGEVAWLLQDGQTEEVWGQTLTGDNKQDFPVLNGAKVYEVNKYAVCEDAQVTGEPIGVLYSNSNKPVYGPHKDDGSGEGTAYDNKCDFCGKLYHIFNENGICEEDNYHQGVITNTSYNTTVAYRGEATNAEPKAGDFTVASGTEPEYTWYAGDVTSGDLPEESLKTAPKELGTYTLVINAAGGMQDNIVYTAKEWRVLVTIEKEALAGNVSLNGTAKYGETLTVVTGIKNNDPGAISYQWYRVDGENVTAIDGATGDSYTLTVEDIDKKIKVIVSSAYCEGNLSATTESVVSRLDGSAELTSASAQLSKSWDGTTIVTPSFTTINETGTNNENVIFEYKKITDTDYTTTAPTDAGTYHVRVKVKADSIHKEAVSEPVEFTIAKVDAVVVVAPVAATNLILEQGKMVTLIDATNASVSGGQLQYALSEAGTYSAALPTVTEAGTYSVYYKVVGDQNHNDTKPVKIDVTVSKKIEEKKDSTATQPKNTTTSQPPKNGDVVTDEKTKAKFEVTDVSKKEVTYNAPTDNKAKDITVPDTVTINGEVYKVTKIDDNAFKGNKAVTNITIGSNVKTIGKNAFSGCKKLKTIMIKSKTLTDKKISKKAFNGISKKVVIKVPKKKLAAYKKLFKKKGLSSKNKIKGY